jgi:23S rRNA pseudouridine1911/1915/1917 synthase
MTLQQRQRPQPEPVELTVLYEDEALVALDKPAGQVVHPTYKNSSGTLLNGVLWRYRDRPGVQPGILTRLDKGTTGVVLIALTPELHARMQRGRIDKEYLAVVRGTPEPAAGVIALPLARDTADRRRVVVSDAGAACETRYEVMGPFVKCAPITGRTHQIRVHLAALGYPIVGDATYGEADARITRQALHAWRVSLTHPVTREPLLIEAPLPDDIRSLVTA